MSFAADDDVIMDGDAHQAACFGDLVGDLDVGAAGLGGAGGVIVDHALQNSKKLIFMQ